MDKKREIQEIYRNKLQDAEWMRKEHEKNDRMADKIMGKIAQKGCTMEEIRDSLYGLAISAEEQGFAAGFYYAEKLLLDGLDLLKDLNDL